MLKTKSSFLSSTSRCHFDYNTRTIQQILSKNVRTIGKQQVADYRIFMLSNKKLDDSASVSILTKICPYKLFSGIM